MAFIGRRSEMRLLSREFDSAEPSLVIVYGRRRIGKSRLIQEAAARRPNVYFQATRLEPSANLDLFQQDIARVLGVDPREDGIADWLGTLRFLARHAENHAQGLIVTLDEFPYLADADKALPSVLQKFWDSGAAELGAMKLVLCGSAVAQMESLLSESNPLYGRKTLALDVGPLPLRDAAAFFPSWGEVDTVTAYAVFGGVPHYLRACDPETALRDNLERLLFSNSGRFVEEPTNLLQSEVGQVRRYASILSVVAKGLNTSGEIAGRLPEVKGTPGLTQYLDTLVRLRLLRREHSMDATSRERHSRYAIIDPLMAFWHRFVQPNASAIARDKGAEVVERYVWPRMPDYMGSAFEEICREHARSHLDELTGVSAQEIGQIWGHAGFDIDVAGRDLDGAAIFGECKWTAAPIGEAVLDKLRRSIAETAYGRNAKASHRLLYARSGFTSGIEAAAARDPNLHLVGPAGMFRPAAYSAATRAP